MKSGNYRKCTKEKINLGQIFTEVVIKCLNKVKDIIEEKITEKNVEMLNLYQDILKRKLTIAKIVENEIIK